MARQVVLDTETTGLDVKKDSIVSIGGVRMHGQRIFRDVTIDWLVNPGRSIPAASTRIHGITDPMVVRSLREFAAALELLDLNDSDRAHVDAFAAKLEGADSL